MFEFLKNICLLIKIDLEWVKKDKLFNKDNGLWEHWLIGIKYYKFVFNKWRFFIGILILIQHQEHFFDNKNKITKYLTMII